MTVKHWNWRSASGRPRSSGCELGRIGSGERSKLFLEEEMRPWEKTFPDELWVQFGRLTRWKGPIHERPKYWGKLVMELVYGYLDPDVCEWLEKHAPAPRSGQNYHQWQRMAEKFGREGVQFMMYLPPPNPGNRLNPPDPYRPNPLK